MKRLTLILMTLICVSAYTQKPIRIYSLYTEHYAASQLDSLLRAGGCKTTFGGKSTGRTIYVGVPPWMKKKYKPLVDSLRNDGYFIVSDGRDVVLQGKGEKGTLYAVYAFLEKIGYRLYTPEAMVVPDLGNNLRLSTFHFHIIENPAFDWREVSYYYPNHSQLYADWHHLHTQADRNQDWGMFVHTFQWLIPTSRYFDKHPEWFSLNNGRRSRDGQLCLSDPEVLEELCKRLTDTMASAPQKRIWSVSPNDNYNACECDNCRRLDSLYGGQSGTLLWFINQVARRFPEKTIATLAYQYTRKAPASNIWPESNVLIMLCPIEAGREAPVYQTDPAFRKDMEDWGRLTDNLFIWDYVVQFRNFWNPFPNLHVLQPNLQYFCNHGVRMMFEQASGANNITSWMDIRCYMIAKLMWNPDADMDSIMADFYQGYYGNAGTYIKGIVDKMTSALKQSGQRLDIYGYPVDAADGYLSPEHRRQYWQLITDAWNAITDSTVDSRFYYFYTSLLFAEVELAINEGTASKEDLLSWLDRLTDLLHKLNVPQMMEMGITPEEYRTTILRYLEKRGPDNKARHKTVTLRKPASAPYNNAGLADGKAGIMDYRHDWLGFWGDTFDAVVDLGEPQPINYIGIDFFFYPLSWIFLPQWVRFAVSEDGEHWEWRPMQESENPEVLATPEIYSYISETACTIGGEPNKYRYVRVVAVPLPEIPAWHRAAGQKPWIFTDEIIVK